MMKFRKSAFSLIELSLVILIIGIFVAGVTSGTRMIHQFRLQTAQSLTQSSPVINKGLALWLETSYNTNLITADNDLPDDGDSVQKWYEINATERFQNYFEQSTSNNQPSYIKDAINGIPALRFNGSTSFMDNNQTGLVGNISDDATWFFVVKFDNSSDSQMLLNDNESYNSDGYYINYYNGSNDHMLCLTSMNAPSINHQSCKYSFNSFIKSQATILVFHKDAQTITIKVNGNQQATTDVYAKPSSKIEQHSSKARIGRSAPSGSGQFLDGDLGEIIVYDRALSNKDIEHIEDYLSQKWHITIN